MNKATTTFFQIMENIVYCKFAKISLDCMSNTIKIRKSFKYNSNKIMY